MFAAVEMATLSELAHRSAINPGLLGAPPTRPEPEYGWIRPGEWIGDTAAGPVFRVGGFVEMGTDAEAQAAIQALNGKENDGRALTVNEARPIVKKEFSQRGYR